MKRILTAVIGIALFIAGYHHTRRAAEFTTVRQTESSVMYSPQPTLPSVPVKQSLLSFRVAKAL
ncbi:hypothetical protein [Spirosoma knui]